jgi:hypothetical protein
MAESEKNRHDGDDPDRRSVGGCGESLVEPNIG